MGEWTSSFVEGPAGPMHIVRTGDGSKPPLILLHGFTDNARCWERVARAFEDRFDVVMVDARNHGRSARGPGGPGELVADVIAVLDGLVLSSVAMIGHSLGGRTGAQVAADRPDLVGRLVLEDPPWTRLRARRVLRMVRRRFAQGPFIESLLALDAEQILAQGRGQNPGWHDDDFPAWVEAKHQLDPRAAEALRPTWWWRTARALPCPTLLVHGDPPRGGMVSPGVAAEVADRNPRISTVRITGAGHNIRRERFDEFVRVVDEFLADR